MLRLRLRDAQMQNCAMHERTRLTHKCGDETDNLERNGNERRHTSMHHYARTAAEWVWEEEVGATWQRSHPYRPLSMQ